MKTTLVTLFLVALIAMCTAQNAGYRATTRRTLKSTKQPFAPSTKMPKTKSPKASTKEPKDSKSPKADTKEPKDSKSPKDTKAPTPSTKAPKQSGGSPPTDPPRSQDSSGSGIFSLGDSSKMAVGVATLLWFGL